MNDTLLKEDKTFYKTKHMLSKHSILSKTNGVCGICGKELDLATMTIDHYIPVSRGGKSVQSNLYPLCNRCNIEKSNDIIYPEDCYPLLSLMYKSSLEANFDKWASDMRKLMKQLSEILVRQNGETKVIESNNLEKLIKKSVHNEYMEIINKGEIAKIFIECGINVSTKQIFIALRNIEFGNWIKVDRNMEFKFVLKKGVRGHGIV